jgi:hypothetical protein
MVHGLAITHAPAPLSQTSFMAQALLSWQDPARATTALKSKRIATPNETRCLCISLYLGWRGASTKILYCTFYDENNIRSSSA